MFLEHSDQVKNYISREIYEEEQNHEKVNPYARSEKLYFQRNVSDEYNHDKVNPYAEGKGSMCNHIEEKRKGCEVLSIHNSLVPVTLGVHDWQGT